MRRQRNKNIIAIESWEGASLEPKAGMRSLLNFITETNNTHYSYNFTYTPTELSYILENIPTKDFSLLYFALHGRPEKISLGMYTEFEITLSELAIMIGKRFKGFGIHFASCAVMSAWDETLRDFMDKTEVLFISGYDRYVDFNESSLVDLALINRWMYARNYRRMFENMQHSYKPLLIDNGFKYYI